jgi:parvulin-like peptidyl-prolyl isomerase
MEDAGRIPRGVLEPAAEYALFTLSPGAVSDPVETPRGFWIVKRIE